MVKAIKAGSQDTNARRPGGHGGGHNLRLRPRVAVALPKIIQQSTRWEAAILLTIYLFGPKYTQARMRTRRMLTSFLFSSFDALTSTPATDTALADYDKARTKDGSEE